MQIKISEWSIIWQLDIESWRSYHTLTTPCGLTLIISHRPLNADSFSSLSRMSFSALSHAWTNSSKCGATRAGQTKPNRPIVIAVFSSRVRGVSGLRTSGNSRWSNASTYGCISPFHCKAISPAAQAALLHTDTCSNVGSTCSNRCGKNEGRTLRTCSKQEIARSPNSA